MHRALPVVTSSRARPGSPWLPGSASPPPLLDAKQTCAEATALPGCSLPVRYRPTVIFLSHVWCHSLHSLSGSPSPIGCRPWALPSFLRLSPHPWGLLYSPETPAGGFSHPLPHPASQPLTHSCFSPGFRLQVPHKTSHFPLLSLTPHLPSLLQSWGSASSGAP